MSTHALTRLSTNYQVVVPKAARDALGLKRGDILEARVERGAVVLRPKQLTDKPIPESAATPAELRAFKRGRAEVARGETIPYEQYRAERAARLDRQRGQKRAKAAR